MEQRRRCRLNDQALWLFNHLFDGLEGHICIFTADRVLGPTGPADKLTNRRSNYFAYPAEVDATVRHAAAQNRVGRETYFCAHLLTEQERAKENASPIQSFWADGDLAKFEGFSVISTAVVESSPGRYHYYLRCAEPLAPVAARCLLQHHHDRVAGSQARRAFDDRRII